MGYSLFGLCSFSSLLFRGNSFLFFFFASHLFTMADTAPAERVKPTKPDEEAYKANLAQAEKEHTAAQEKLV